MPEVTATEAARSFADLPDGVEHRGEEYVIVRRGKAIARLEPTSNRNGRALKKLLREMPPDPDWANDILEVRRLLEIETRD